MPTQRPAHFPPDQSEDNPIRVQEVTTRISMAEAGSCGMCVCVVYVFDITLDCTSQNGMGWVDIILIPKWRYIYRIRSVMVSDFMSHNITDVSSEPVIRYCVFGGTVRHVTDPLWPSKLNSYFMRCESVIGDWEWV